MYDFLSVGAELIVADADVGGVQIAEGILSAIPDATLIDIGATRTRLARRSLMTESPRADSRPPSMAPQVAARACLERGYRIEQEIPTVAAVDSALAR